MHQTCSDQSTRKVAKIKKKNYQCKGIRETITVIIKTGGAKVLERGEPMRDDHGKEYFQGDLPVLSEGTGIFIHQLLFVID